MSAAPLLAVAGLTKRFAATLALDDVGFELAAGEVHALVGENGAGKTTLLNVLSGVVQPDAGEIRLAGSTISIGSPRQAQTLGIATVFQELSLTGAVSIGENIFAGRAPSRFGAIDWPRLRRDADALLAELGLSLDVRTPLAEAPVSLKQMVEIAKALSQNARILLLDEPTAALSPTETERLFSVIRRLAGRGLGIVYVSHHLSEVLRIADRITVLRDGRVVARRRPAETDQDGLVRDMVGRELAGWSRKRGRHEGKVLLAARDLSRHDGFRDVNLTLRAGEVIGIAGLIGSFRGAVGRTLCGILAPTSGEIVLRGKAVRWSGLAQAVRQGLAYVPEDRKADGLFQDLSVRENIVAASLSRMARHGLYPRKRSEQAARSGIAALGIKASDPEAAVRGLSGGNQQKTLLARWLETQPEIIIVDEPTRGVDVAAKRDIHAILSRLADSGAGIVVISSDLMDLMALADRILVMHAGRIAGELDAAEASEERIVALASGLGDAKEQAA
jgi:ABC-type sugar transport system ATPase subunit